MSESSISCFEHAFADTVKQTHAFAFWKGRVALYALLKALDIGPGDEVILPGYTCVMDVNPIKYLGAKPVYVDIEPVTFNLDVQQLPHKITPKTKAILAQHTYGYPCDMDAILNLAQPAGIAVLEDCCLALGSTYKGKLCGTMGDGAYFSFQWNKPFTTGVGGMAITNSEHLARRLEELCRQELHHPAAKAAFMLSLQRIIYRAFIYPRTTALATNMFRWLTKKHLVVGSSSTCEFQPTMPADFFTGMSAGQARAGLRQLRRLQANIDHRKNMRLLYDNLLRDAGWPVPAIPDRLDPVLVRYPVRVADKQQALAEAPAHGVEIGSWFECPLHPLETPMHLYDYQPGMCPVAELACREVINLPTHPRADHKTAQRSVEFIKTIGPPI